MMTRLIFLLIFSVESLLITAQQNIRLVIKNAAPAKTPGQTIFIAGSFNNWNPQNEQFRFQQDEKGNHFIDMKLPAGSYEYKITRGGWDKVECSKDGAGIGNRILKVDGDAIVEINVEGWQDQFAVKAKLSTAGRNVQIIETSFWMPQLKRSRRIWIYLPENYAGTKERFPVLYMHDGQNLFEDTSSFSGEWGIDEFLDSTRLKNCIVVGIDNGGGHRLSEYAPYDFTLDNRSSSTKVEGKGSEYVDFLVKTLKPFIDKHYRTKKDKGNTFVAGSSMGGLISMYAVVKYPKVFGGAGIFSPSFWTSKKIFDDIKKKSKKIRSNIFFYVGKQEGDQMVPDMLKGMQALAAKSKSKIKTVIRDEGRHNEATWRKEFPTGYSWMLYGKEPILLQ
ncbi:MAG TPA: alpha/beta hydrolase-fold protein [Chitinophagaceae bacterium]